MPSSISKMAILLGWGGQPAESGLARSKKALDATGKAAKDSAGPWQSLTESMKGFADFSAGIGLIKGFTTAIYDSVHGILALGGQLEVAQLKAAYLAGSFDKGAAAIDGLRDVSIRTGVPLDNLSKGFHELVSAGLSVGAVGALLRDTAGAISLLGGGAAGMDKLTSAFGQLAHSTTATEGALESLQNGGLQVFEALANRLEKLTGKAYTARQAMKALQDGTVLAGTALQAIQDAANTPAAAAAAERFKSSFEGKLQEVGNVATETFRDVGKSLIDAFKITEALSGFKGFIVGLRDIALEIGKAFELFSDPLKKSAGVEASFKTARDFAYEFGKAFAQGAVAFKEALQTAIIQIEGLIDKAGTAAKLGITGWTTGETDKVFESIDRTTRLKLAPVKSATDAANKKIEAFFDNINANAAAADQAAAAAKEAAEAQAAQGAAAQQLAMQAKAAQAALELSARNIKEWTRDSLEATATPFEKIKKDFQDLGNLVAQASQAGLDLTQEEISRFQEAIGRKASKSLSDFITANEGGGTGYQASSAARGSAADVEAIIRNRFGEEGKDVQTRIEQATLRNAAIAERQLEIQHRQLDALSRIPNPPAILAFPRN